MENLQTRLTNTQKTQPSNLKILTKLFTSMESKTKIAKDRKQSNSSTEIKTKTKKNIGER